MRPSPLAVCLPALGVLLVACGGDDPAPAAALPSQSAAPAPSPSPSAAEDAGARSPEELGAMLDFSSVATTTPAQAQAVADYEEFIRSFAIAQGLPDAAYPPLLATMGTELGATIVGQLEATVEAEEYIDGPYVERVLEVGTGPETIAMRVCSDITGRTVRDQATGEAKPGSSVPRTTLLITSSVTPEGYAVQSIAVPPGDASC